MKNVLVTGITGQDGYFLTKLLLEKGCYRVHGIVRKNNQSSIGTLQNLLPEEINQIQLHWGDITDNSFVAGLIREIEFDEVYHLLAQSSVGLSFNDPSLTYRVNIGGTLNLLNAIKEYRPQARVYFAGTSEMFGKVQTFPQTEETPFNPQSPYGVSKLAGFWTVKNYREAYGLFFVTGILFNHESEYRGDAFVTKKVARTIARIAKGSDEVLRIGNLDVKRDWGYAGEYVDGMWRMLQQVEPDDYILATGTNHTVREFIEIAFRSVCIPIVWSGEGMEEVAVHAETGRVLVSIDPAFFRPAEIDVLVGDASKAERVLGWKSKMNFEQLVAIMVNYELAKI